MGILAAQEMGSGNFIRSVGDSHNVFRGTVAFCLV